MIIVVLILISLIAACFFLHHQRDHFEVKDVSCKQLCDLDHPGLLASCAGKRGATKTCKVYDDCVDACQKKQLEEIKEEVQPNLPIDPEQNWGSRYSHLMR